MKLLIIGASKPSISTNMLIKEAEKKFNVLYVPIREIILKITTKNITISYNKRDLSKFDYCLPRIDSKRAQHGYHVIRCMDIINVKKPYSAETILIAHNKYTTLEVLRRADVPIPTTYLVDSPKTAEKLLKKMRYPIMVKVVASFGGKGVMFFEDKESAISAIKTLKLYGHQIIVEEYVPNPGEDIRAFVIGGKIIASMKRIASKDETRANIHIGGRGMYFGLTGELKDVALKAAAASGSDIVAIDMIESNNGPKVIEININPGLKGIQKITSINVAKAIIDFVKNEVE